MKIILLRDIAGVGKKWDVKDVSSGHARNFLIPRGLAEHATKSRINELERDKKTKRSSDEAVQDLLKKNLEALAGTEVVIRVAASERGHLFQGVHEKEVIEALGKALQTGVDRSMIELKGPIREVGEHIVTVRAGETKTTFTLKVIPA